MDHFHLVERKNRYHQLAHFHFYVFLRERIPDAFIMKKLEVIVHVIHTLAASATISGNSIAVTSFKAGREFATSTT